MGLLTDGAVSPVIVITNQINIELDVGGVGVCRALVWSVQNFPTGSSSQSWKEFLSSLQLLKQEESMGKSEKSTSAGQSPRPCALTVTC